MRRLILIVVVSLLAIFALLSPLTANAKKTIHLVPHTHDDMGWLKTVEQYQYGLNNTIHMANINAIISSVIGGLLLNSERKFTYVEIGFFSRWWDEQTDEMKKIVRKLVSEDRLQFANGAWCMHDEASTHFMDMIDQTTLGHRWLQRELKVVPRVGWQVDPFGHSATQGAILTARAGFIGTYFSRIDYADDKYRGETGRRQFWWQASPSLPELRTFVEINLHQTYCPPMYFRWDVLSYWSDAEKNVDTTDVIDDKNSERYNVPLVLKRFKDEVRENIKVTKGDHIMWTMGCDFHYFTSELWFSNMDKLIKLVKADGEFDIRYSTPYEYTLAKLKEAKNGVVYDTKKDDFFPYANAPNQYWTGYFSSRPTLKRILRQLSSYWTASRQIQFLAGIPSGEVSSLSDALAIGQHHDAITGTAKQHVTFDYIKRLSEGYQEDISQRLTHALAEKPFDLSRAQHCLLSNISVCSATTKGLSHNGSKITVFIWNSNAHPVMNALVQIPVPREDILVTGEGVKKFSVFASSLQVSDYENNNSEALLFTLAVELSLKRSTVLTLSTYSSSSYYNNNNNNNNNNIFAPSVSLRQRSSLLKAQTQHLQSFVEISNDDLILHFNGDGLLDTVTDRKTNKNVKILQDWCYFRSNKGDNISFMPGGAYIMRPVTNAECEPITTQPVKLRIIDRTIGVVEQQFGKDLVQRLTLHGDVIDMEFTSFEIPVDDGFGRELVTRFRTSINNGDVFYTDSNGREMQRRQVDFRSDFPFTQTEPIAGNYYPVSTLLFINDTQTQFNIFPDAAMGGTSIRNGEVLLTANRRLLLDDAKGVDEALNETAFVTDYTQCISTNITSCGKHYGPPLRVRGTLSFSLTPGGPHAMRRVREQQDEKYYTPLVLFSDLKRTKLNSDLDFGLPLPPSLQLLTIQLLDKKTLLLRIGHRYAVDEDVERSLPVKVDMRKIISKVTRYRVERIDEVSLTSSEIIKSKVKKIEVKPMDIRTFIYHLRKHK